MLGRKLTPGEVAILETLVIPGYLAHFGNVVLEMLLSGESARVAHLGCRTGYPDRQLLDRIHDCEILGVDSSLAAIELARNKAATLRDARLEYSVATEFPTELDAGTFSHTLALHPIGTRAVRSGLFREMTRLLYAGGQALVALPLRGSFQEVADLLREFALKHDDAVLEKAMDKAVLELPTLETLTDELELAGLADVDTAMRPLGLPFGGGRAFIEDPVTRLFILPTFEALLDGVDLRRPAEYVAQAVDKYWANRQFEVQVKIGVASARRR